MRITRLATALFLFWVVPSTPDEPLTFVRAVALPGVEGRFDHLTFDAAHNRLFIAALGNNTVEVIDLDASTHLKSLPGFREPQGIAAVPDVGLVVVANGQGEGVQLLRAGDLEMANSVRIGDDADNVRYDAGSKRVFVGYGGGAIAAVSVADGKVIGEAKLPGHPESFQLERTGSRIFVNVPGAGRISVIDRTTMTVVASWSVISGRANYPMTLDDAGHRLIVGCRSPAKALVFDTTTGKELGGFDIVGDTDDLFYDASRKRLYVAGGDGYLDVFQDDGGAKFTRLTHLPTAAGARTALFVRERNELYLAVPHRGSQRAEVRTYAIR